MAAGTESIFSSIRAVYRPIRRPLLVFLVPLILLPLPLYFQTKAAACGYVVLFMSFLWVTETIPMAATALVPLIAYPVLGIMQAKAVASEYLTDTNFVFFGSLLLAMGVETSKLHERIALKILMITGTNPRWLLLGFQISTAFLSMWISNTATAAMMLPIVTSVICELDFCRRKHDFPNDIIVKQELRNINFSDSAPKDQKIYKALLLSICFSASIGGIGTIIGTGPNLIMAAYLDEEYSHHSPVTFAKWIMFAFPQMIAMVIFLWVWLQILFVGFGTDNQETEIEKVLRKVLTSKYEQLGAIKYSEKTIAALFSTMVLLWFFRDPKIFDGWGSLFPPGYVTDSTVSLGIGFLLFVLPSENPLRAKSRSVDEEPRAIITWKDMHERFSWGTIMLLGGGFAMAKGVEASGLSVVVGERLSSMGDLPEWVFVLVACFCVTALTEFSSNIATASIFIPLVASIAKNHNTNQLLYVLPTTLSCSFAFMFPAGTPPNAIVFSAGLLKVIDMVKAGFMLNIFGFIVIFTATHSYSGWLFDLTDSSSLAQNGTLAFN